MTRYEGIEKLKMSLKDRQHELRLVYEDISFIEDRICDIEEEIEAAENDPSWLPPQPWRPGQRKALIEMGLEDLIDKENSIARSSAIND